MQCKPRSGHFEILPLSTTENSVLALVQTKISIISRVGAEFGKKIENFLKAFSLHKIFFHFKIKR